MSHLRQGVIVRAYFGYGSGGGGGGGGGGELPDADLGPDLALRDGVVLRGAHGGRVRTVLLAVLSVLAPGYPIACRPCAAPSWASTSGRRTSPPHLRRAVCPSAARRNESRGSFVAVTTRTCGEKRELSASSLSASQSRKVNAGCIVAEVNVKGDVVVASSLGQQHAGSAALRAHEREPVLQLRQHAVQNLRGDGGRVGSEALDAVFQKRVWPSFPAIRTAQAQRFTGRLCRR